MTRRAEEAPATHYRLAPETWALVVEDYADGATAKEVGAKWKVAPSSGYRQAAAAGRGKRSVGDVRGRGRMRAWSRRRRRRIGRCSRRGRGR